MSPENWCFGRWHFGMAYYQGAFAVRKPCWIWDLRKWPQMMASVCLWERYTKLNSYPTFHGKLGTSMMILPIYPGKPNFPKPPKRQNSFINCWWNIRGLFLNIIFLNMCRSSMAPSLLAGLAIHFDSEWVFFPASGVAKLVGEPWRP